MRFRALLLSVSSIAALAAPSVALATDSPAPQPLQPAPSVASIQSVLSKCADNTRPSSTLSTGSRSSKRSRTLRGSAGDKGCGVAMVTVSILRVHGKGCQPITRSGRFGHTGRCTAGRYVLASGTANWRLALPKKLPKGTYVVRVRAIDFAGNVQQARAQRVKLG
jgi:hypothetical protein